MPQKPSLGRKSPSTRPAVLVPQETLVNDSRSGLSPSQMVERRLAAMLDSSLLPASQLQASRTRRPLS
jgi:hypothetical protein